LVSVGILIFVVDVILVERLASVTIHKL
jgi:hypothetical protein